MHQQPGEQTEENRTRHAVERYQILAQLVVVSVYLWDVDDSPSGPIPQQAQSMYQDFTLYQQPFGDCHQGKNEEKKRRSQQHGDWQYYQSR